MTDHSQNTHDRNGDEYSDGADSEGETRLSDRVEAALRRVRDPEVEVNVFEAGLVEDIHLDDGAVTVEADLGDFGAREADEVVSTMVRAVSDVPGVERAHVEQVSQTVENRGDPDATGVAAADRVVAVASAKGGVGKTTVAVHLACALAADDDVGIFDADIHGPNVPGILDVSGPVYSDDEGNPLPPSRRGLEVMSVGLMEEGAPLAWRGAMAHDALTELFEDTAWSSPDTLVFDLPPGTGDIVLTTLQEAPVDGVVFVTTPFHAAVTDTERSLELFRENDVPVLGVVVNMAGYVCDSCGDEHSMFPGGDPTDDFDVPVLAELPFTSDVQGTPAPGAVPAALRETADRVRSRLDEVADPSVPDDAVDLRGVPPERRREMVAEAFEETASGETFALASDRDPTPVLGFLAGQTDRSGPPGRVFDDPDVVQLAPETWTFRVTRP